jgi:hypothetical protein
LEWPGLFTRTPGIGCLQTRTDQPAIHLAHLR